MTTLLVIEDEAPIRANLCELLEAEGFAVLSAASGSEGIELARERRPDLVVCDIMMPGVDGYEVLEKLRSESETRLTPFVFLTALSDKADRRRGMASGADDFVTKPFTREDLLSAIAARLERAELADERLDSEMQRLRASVALSLPHELRTPLSSIVAGAMLLESRADAISSEDVRRMAGLMRASGQRLERLITNYLLFAELQGAVADSDADEAATARADAAATIAPAAEFAAAALGRGCDLEVDLSDAIVAISAEHLGKVVEELVDNACKFSASGSAVRVTGQAEGATFVLLVTDTGCGMSAEEVERVGAFMQFDRARREQQGSGLGLAIVRGLAAMHGGTLGLVSVPGRGTTARVELPLAGAVHGGREATAADGDD